MASACCCPRSLGDGRSPGQRGRIEQGKIGSRVDRIKRRHAAEPNFGPRRVDAFWLLRPSPDRTELDTFVFVKFLRLVLRHFVIGRGLVLMTKEFGFRVLDRMDTRQLLDCLYPLYGRDCCKADCSMRQLDEAVALTMMYLQRRISRDSLPRGCPAQSTHPDYQIEP